MDAVRVRFAPSPTGNLHLGGLRTALYNYLFAASNGGLGSDGGKRGKLIMRIEDTDQERTVPGAVDRMMKTFNWLGIAFDEGPNVGGEFGPYTQSQRLQHYRQYAQELINRDASYYCFCSKERLELLRKTNGGYDGLCRTLSQRQINEKLSQGIPYITRLKVASEGTTVVEDKVYGRVPIINKTIDDQVLLKGDGMPTYHLANVVDDHLMAISHVLRGEEWLTSTSKHLIIYKAMNWSPPVFIHLPLLMSSSGGKLSKRKDDVFVHSYQERGFLPEALLNFVALLGWSPKSSIQEVFSIDQLVESFSIELINKGSVLVDEAKLLWYNGQHYKLQCKDTNKLNGFIERLRAVLLARHDLNLSADDYLVSSDYLKQVLLTVDERSSLVCNIPDLAPYFWTAPNYSESKSKSPPNKDLIQDFATFLEEDCEPFDERRLKKSIKSFSLNRSVKEGKTMSMIRYVLCGGMAGPTVVDTAIVLGRERILKRFQHALESLPS